MSAGLPGLGLGGLLFIFTALLAPLRQLWLTATGRGRRDDWPKVGRQFAQAVLMVAAIDLTLRLAYLTLDVLGVGEPPPADAGTVLPLTLIGITTGLLAVVLVAAKLTQLAVRVKGGALPRIPVAMPRRTPLRAVALGGTAAVAWLALLAGGASELSPLAEPEDEPQVAKGSDGKGAPPRGGGAQADPRQAGPARTVAPPAEADPAVRSPVQSPGGDAPARRDSPAGQGTPESTVEAPSVEVAAPRHPPAATRPEAPAVEPESPALEGGAGAGPPPRGGPPETREPPATPGPPPTAGPEEGSGAPAGAGPPPHAGRD